MSDTNIVTCGSSSIAPIDDTQRLMAIAIEQGEAGVAALERLVAMRERAEDRLASRQYTEAIARFQELCPVVAKNSAGAHGARYAALDGIMDAIRPAMVSAGLSVTFDSEEADGGRLRVWCIVHHRAGHSERASFIVSREAKSNRMNDTQRDGSALSYGRRYALCLALGISTGERDDDGAGAGATQEPRITDEQAADLQALAEEVGITDPDVLLRGLASVAGRALQAPTDLPARLYGQAVARLERRRAQS